MPGFEFFGEAEKRHVNEVLETGILMRYGFDGPRKGIWKAKELEQPSAKHSGQNMRTLLPAEQLLLQQQWLH
jgi:8-amino-3,8-dideoxy-alpha-D-manno-octulosonate transaminase